MSSSTTQSQGPEMSSLSPEAENPANPLHIVFLPFPTPGHMFPMVDLARAFASHRGVKCTVITTPANAEVFERSVSGARASRGPITVLALDFPASAVGLPAGVENFGSLTSLEMSAKLFYALAMLQNPTQGLIRDMSPDCIISDMFYPWTSDFAAEVGCPRLVFHTSSVFSICCEQSLEAHAPHERVDCESGTVTLPLLPDRIEMRKSQLPAWARVRTAYTDLNDKMKEAELKSYGIVANTFYEIEPAYVDFYEKETGLKVWPVGPVSLQSDGDEAAIRGERGRKGAVDWSACLGWLDSKTSGSVLYVSFGSLTKFPSHQLREIAAGLEAAGHDFVWVVRRRRENGEDYGEEDWFPEGFRERMRENSKGLIIEDWAPQLLILEHPAVGAVVTHCGWNSILEGVNAGLPLVTWPLFAEQFYNERLVVDVLRVGVDVGVTTWCDAHETGQKEVVGREKLEAAVRSVMGDEDKAKEIRQRARELGEAAKKAVKIGGSSQANLADLISELRNHRSTSTTANSKEH